MPLDATKGSFANANQTYVEPLLFQPLLSSPLILNPLDTKSIISVVCSAKLALVKSLIRTIFGATPNPWPTVEAAPPPVYLVRDIPAVVLTLTVELIAPSVFAEPVPPAFQFHETKVWLPLFTPESVPTVNPSLSKDVISVELVYSALLLLLAICFVTPLITSVRLCE